MLGWFVGDLRSYSSPIITPLEGWRLYNTTTTGIFNVVEGDCYLPTPTPTPTSTPSICGDQDSLVDALITENGEYIIFGELGQCEYFMFTYIEPTPTPTPPQQYYVYQICNSTPSVYIVQTQPGYTIIPNKVFRYGLDYGFPIGILYFCSEFLYVTSTFPTFPPGANVTNYTGNFFTIINPQSVFDKCSDCLVYVEPPPVQSYYLLGPYSSSYQACTQANLAGSGLGTATFSNGITVGSQVYNTPLFGTTQLVTIPGWYAAAPSFLTIYSSFRIDNTGTIVEVGSLLCF
jgi:hypothetical protein